MPREETVQTTVAAGSVTSPGTPFTVPVSSLAPGTAYRCAPYATNGPSTGYSSVGTFTTLPATNITAVSGSGTYGGTATLSATLLSNGTGVAGKSIAFTLKGTGVGSATTDSHGGAALTNVDLTGDNAGSYPGAVSATFSGDSGYGASGPTTGGPVEDKVTQAQAVRPTPPPRHRPQLAALIASRRTSPPTDGWSLHSRFTPLNVAFGSVYM